MAICRAAGCDVAVHVRGLCNAHYLRLRRNGSLDPKIAMFRERISHPLYSKWQSAKKFGLDSAWADFPAFVAGVGDPPHTNSRLRKKHPTEPLGPQNFRWVSIRTDEEKREINKRGASRRYFGKVISGEPVWTDSARNCFLLRKYGISLEDYNRLLEAQGSVCAICLKDDTVKRLAVDHCHSLGVVRGLLCQSCNLSIGRMGDDPSQLRRAAAYLLRGSKEAEHV